MRSMRADCVDRRAHRLGGGDGAPGGGCRCGPVLDGWDVVVDPQLAARDFFHALPHARFARDLVFGQAVRLSETPVRSERAAPAFGEHSRDVLRELTDLDDAAIDPLVDEGSVQVMEHEEVVFERPYLHWLRRCNVWCHGARRRSTLPPR